MVGLQSSHRGVGRYLGSISARERLGGLWNSLGGLSCLLGLRWWSSVLDVGLELVVVMTETDIRPRTME